MNILGLFDGMLEYKLGLGYAKKSYECYLKEFCRYFLENGFTAFSEETVLPWCVIRSTESAEGFRRRVGALREFSKYLYAIGVTDYILPTSIYPVLHRKNPYIPSDQEMINLFNECDKEEPCKNSPCRHLIIKVIFRLIYFCGLRPNEGRELMRSDFDEKDETLLIRKNKTRMERLIPVSDDVAEMLRKYLVESKKIYPDAKYMFPTRADNPYDRKWLAATFKRLWNAANPDSKATEVRIYLLRHRFATAVFMKWLDEQADLNAKLPFLSAYMGHSSFSDTAYYIHLLPEKLLASSSIDWSRFNKLLPEVEDE